MLPSIVLSLLLVTPAWLAPVQQPAGEIYQKLVEKYHQAQNFDGYPVQQHGFGDGNKMSPISSYDHQQNPFHIFSQMTCPCLNYNNDMESYREPHKIIIRIFESDPRREKLVEEIVLDPNHPSDSQDYQPHDPQTFLSHELSPLSPHAPYTSPLLGITSPFHHPYVNHHQPHASNSHTLYLPDPFPNPFFPFFMPEKKHDGPWEYQVPFAFQQDMTHHPLYSQYLTKYDDTKKNDDDKMMHHLEELVYFFHPQPHRDELHQYPLYQLDYPEHHEQEKQHESPLSQEKPRLPIQFQHQDINGHDEDNTMQPYNPLIDLIPIHPLNEQHKYSLHKVDYPGHQPQEMQQQLPLPQEKPQKPIQFQHELPQQHQDINEDDEDDTKQSYLPFNLFPVHPVNEQKQLPPQLGYPRQKQQDNQPLRQPQLQQELPLLHQDISEDDKDNQENNFLQHLKGQPDVERRQQDRPDQQDDQNQLDSQENEHRNTDEKYAISMKQIAHLTKVQRTIPPNVNPNSWISESKPVKYVTEFDFVPEGEKEIELETPKEILEHIYAKANHRNQQNPSSPFPQGGPKFNGMTGTNQQQKPSYG